MCKTNTTIPFGRLGNQGIKKINDDNDNKHWHQGHSTGKNAHVTLMPVF